jgi:hypothetical protein
MSVGVTHAGYITKEEFPILLCNFLVPALIAVMPAWQLAHGCRNWRESEQSFRQP